MNARQKYSGGAIALHWLHAALVLFLIGWGLWMADLPKGPDRGWAFGIHKSFGLLAIIFIIVRIGWRLGHRPPPNTALTPQEDRLAGLGHLGLYALLVAVPLAGLSSVNFTKYPLKFFGIEIPKFGYPDEAINHFFSTTHEWLAYALMGLVAIHIAAAIRHGLRRDGTLARMSPHSSKPTENEPSAS